MSLRTYTLLRKVAEHLCRCHCWLQSPQPARTPDGLHRLLNRTRESEKSEEVEEPCGLRSPVRKLSAVANFATARGAGKRSRSSHTLTASAPSAATSVTPSNAPERDQDADQAKVQFRELPFDRAGTRARVLLVSPRIHSQISPRRSFHVAPQLQSACATRYTAKATRLCWTFPCKGACVYA